MLTCVKIGIINSFKHSIRKGYKKLLGKYLTYHLRANLLFFNYST